MPLVPAADIIRAFDDVLGVPVISHTPSTPGYDLYEVFLFGLCVEAAESIGMQVEFCDTEGDPVTSLVLRTSPSAIWSTAQRFTHARFLVDEVVRLEAHLGVYVRSQAGVSHEADVLLLDPGEAARARALRSDPRVSQAALVIEAKFNSSNVRLRTGREFLGLGVDLGAGGTILVCSAPGPSVHRLLSHRNRSAHFDLVPGAAQESELRASIATRIRDRLARAR